MNCTRKSGQQKFKLFNRKKEVQTMAKLQIQQKPLIEVFARLQRQKLHFERQTACLSYCTLYRRIQRKKDNSRDKKADCRQSGFADVLSKAKFEQRTDDVARYVVPKTTLCEHEANPSRCGIVLQKQNKQTRLTPTTKQG